MPARVLGCIPLSKAFHEKVEENLESFSDAVFDKRSQAYHSNGRGMTIVKNHFEGHLLEEKSVNSDEPF